MINLVSSVQPAPDMPPRWIKIYLFTFENNTKHIAMLPVELALDKHPVGSEFMTSPTTKICVTNVIGTRLAGWIFETKIIPL